jgi:hypothetical protein
MPKGKGYRNFDSSRSSRDSRDYASQQRFGTNERAHRQWLEWAPSLRFLGQSKQTIPAKNHVILMASGFFGLYFAYVTVEMLRKLLTCVCVFCISEAWQKGINVLHTLTMRLYFHVSESTINGKAGYVCLMAVSVPLQACS